MNNLSQNNEMFDNEPKNNEKRLTELISTIYNEFKFIGKVINEPKKDILNKKIVCYIRLALQSGVIVDLRAYNKVAEEIATVYKKGDVVAFRGQVLATKKDETYIPFLIVKQHLLIQRNSDFKTLDELENDLAKIEKLYDPYNVMERMKGEDEEK